MDEVVGYLGFSFYEIGSILMRGGKWEGRYVDSGYTSSKLSGIDLC